jgi:hypothetical protein
MNSENVETRLVLREDLARFNLREFYSRSKTLVAILKEFDFDLGSNLLRDPEFLDEFSIETDLVKVRLYSKFELFPEEHPLLVPGKFLSE